MADFKPNFIDKKGKKLSSLPWLNFKEPQVILLQGMRGSGKTVTTEYIAEQFYKKGFTVCHLWGARSFENLYWAINKNCAEPYSKMKIITDAFFRTKGSFQNYVLDRMSLQEKDYFTELMIQQGLIQRTKDSKLHLTEKGKKLHDGDLLHCKCNQSYPITWIIPDYQEIIQETLDRFNGIYWKDMQEYAKYFKEITPKEKEKLGQGKLKKPHYLCEQPKIIVRKITPPTTTHRKEIFKEQFTRILLEAREQHRILVMNPAIFEGQMDKFDTLAEMINHLPYLMHTSGHFMPLDDPKDKWEANWQNIVIVINEVRSVAPSSRMHGEKATSSKKAIFDKIPEMRHMKCWFIADLQNPEDLYAGVRYQANIFIIKKASRNILGEDWKWLPDKIENSRLSMIKKRNQGQEITLANLWFYEKNPYLKEEIDQYRQRVDELDENRGYITFPNNEFKLETFPMPSFHHKASSDDFMKDTGIQWTTDLEKKPQDQETKDIETSVEKTKKKIKDEILKKIDYMRNEGKSFEQIKDELVLQEQQGIIPNMNFADKQPIYFNNWYNRWKKSKFA